MLLKCWPRIVLHDCFSVVSKNKLLELANKLFHHQPSIFNCRTALRRMWTDLILALLRYRTKSFFLYQIRSVWLCFYKRKVNAKSRDFYARANVQIYLLILCENRCSSSKLKTVIITFKYCGIKQSPKIMPLMALSVRFLATIISRCRVRSNLFVWPFSRSTVHRKSVL